MPLRTMLVWTVMTALAGEARAQVVLTPVNYDLRVEIDYVEEVLRGGARITFRNPSAVPVREASLLLYRLLAVREVRDDRGAELPFTQEVVAFADFSKQQVNHVRVGLPSPLDSLEEVSIDVRYDGHLLGSGETGMLYVQDRIDPEFTILRDDARAYPESGYPSMALNRAAIRPAFHYRASITVPSGLVVANGGRLDGIDSLASTVTYRYSSLKPSWRMDFAIAPYTLLTAEGVRVFFLPGDEAGAAGVVEAAKTAMDRFTRWFGERPDPSPLTFIEVPDGWGSQTDVTAIIQSASAFKDPRRHGEVYHEVSHLWNVEPAERPSPRWDEGLASFLEDLVGEQATGHALVVPRADGLLEWLRGELPSHPAWRDTPLVHYGRDQLTDLSYSVGALYFALLHRLAGQAAFERIIGGFVAEFGRGGGTTADLVTLIRANSPLDLRALSDDWLFTTTWTRRITESPSFEALDRYYRSSATPMWPDPSTGAR